MKGCLRVRERAHVDPVLDATSILDRAIDEREKRVVLATTNVSTGVDVRTVLTNENGARRHGLAGEALAAQALAAGVATITGGTESFFVCHVLYLLFRVAYGRYSVAAGAAASASVAVFLAARDVACTLVIFRRVSC